jgi:hypothetical protein
MPPLNPTSLVRTRARRRVGVRRPAGLWFDRRGGPSLPTSRAHALTGKEFFPGEAIARGFGCIRVDDSVRRVAGEDVPTGARVCVVPIEDGSAIRVEKAISVEEAIFVEKD